MSGNQRVIRTTADDHGRFSFNALAFGTYRLAASSAGISGELSVDLGSGGADVTLALTAIKQIGSVKVVRANPVRGSGADVQLNASDLTRAPSSDSFPEALIQLPGTARGANGVVHMNGDHGVIDYVVDGVPIPQALNREIGSEINPNDISYLDAIEGAYPAQYGLRFGSVLNISTRAGTGPPGFDGSVGTDPTETLTSHWGIMRRWGTAAASMWRFAISKRTARSIRRISIRRTTKAATPTSSFA